MMNSGNGNSDENTVILKENWLIPFSLVILALLLHDYRKRSYFEKVGAPYSWTWPIIGSLLTFKLKGILVSDSNGIRKYGKVYGTYLGNIPTLVVADAGMIKEIFVRQFDKFPHRMQALYISKWWENGVVIASGDHWKYLRTLLSPTFSSGKIKKIQPVLNKCLNNTVRYLHDMLKDSATGVFDMREVFSSLTMDIICKTSFGVEIDTIRHFDNEFAKHAKIVSTLNIESNWVNALPLILPSARYLLEFLDIDYVNKTSLDYIKNVVKAILSKRKEFNKDCRHDTLQLMIDAHKNDTNNSKNEQPMTFGDKTLSYYKSSGLTDDELIANAIIILMAGYDTTATTVTWMAFLLATNPDVQEKLIDVIDNEIGMNEPTYENIQNMEYLDMFLSETLRLFPAANRTGRDAIVSTNVCGYNIPKGLSITVPIYAMHRMPEYWDEPEKFVPERFSKENKGKISPYTYMPYGVGPRSCIGMRMAQLVCKTIIVQLLQHFRLNVTDNQEIPPILEKSLLTKPINGMKLRLIPRARK